MEISGSSLYKTLRAIGTVPKTYQVEEITVCTDLTTGKEKKESRRHRYAVIGVCIGERSVSVDFESLRGIAKRMKDHTLDVYIFDEKLHLEYDRGGVVLQNLHGTPSVDLDLEWLLRTSKALM